MQGAYEKEAKALVSLENAKHISVQKGTYEDGPAN